MTQMPALLREEFLLWSRLNSHRVKVASARRRVCEWRNKVTRPYIAFSGGKDSLCVLTLVREEAGFIPAVPAVYFDAECSFPEVDDLLDSTDNMIRFVADEPFLQTLKRIGLNDEHLERITMRTTVYGPIKRLIKEYQFDGVAYGLRAEESGDRALNAYRRGAVFQYRRDSVWACQPIWDWSYRDVWAFIVDNNLPYCGVYDRLWDAPREDQRVSYWAGETKRRWGRYAWLKRNYPELWHRLCAEIPEASCYA